MIATVERQDATRTDTILTNISGIVGIPQSIRVPPRLNRKQRRAIQAQQRRKNKRK